MRLAVFSIAFMVWLGSFDTFAQTSPSDSPPDMQIVKYSWTKDKIGWERDVTYTESYREMTTRIRNERRTGSALEERTKQAQREEQKPAKPPRYAFSYKLQVNNIGSKGITEIDWDYIVTDQTTGEELGRRQFTSVEKVGPGKRKEMIVRVSGSPSNRVSVYSLGKDEHAGLTEKVLITRLLYEDGTTWAIPEIKGP
jgi:hypothetical protein